MKSKLPAPTAKEINEAHRLARSAAETAVEHAIRCGQMLMTLKGSLPHGEFETFITARLDFATSTARKYMKAASQNATGVAFSSLQSLFPSGTKPKPDTSARSVKGAVMNPPESAAQGSEAGNRNTPVGVDTGPVRPPVPGPDPVLADDWTPEVPGAEEMEAIEREIDESEAKVLRTDDVTAGYHDELKRQAAEIAVLKTTRDGYMNGKAAVTKMLQAEQRKTEKQSKRIAELEKENAKLLEQIEALRERVSIMEAA